MSSTLELPVLPEEVLAEAETEADLEPPASPAKATVHDTQNYFYGYCIFIISYSGDSQEQQSADRDAAADAVGVISTPVNNSQSFRAIVKPTHISQKPEDEVMKGIRRVVAFKSEIAEARRKLREAGLQIVGVQLTHTLL